MGIESRHWLDLHLAAWSFNHFNEIKQSSSNKQLQATDYCIVKLIPIFVK
jgi:hypothetical protein